MAGKDNWRRFLDAIYSKWRSFLPILLLFLLYSHSFCHHLPCTPPPPPSPSPFPSFFFFFSFLSPPPPAFSFPLPPPPPPLTWLPIFLFFPFLSPSSPSTSHPNMKYGLTSACLRGRLLVNCKFFGQHGNLFEMTNQAEQFVAEEQLLKLLPLKKLMFGHL